MSRSIPALLVVAIACVLAPSAHALPAREIGGVTVHPWMMQEAGEVERTFADFAALGVRWARVDLRWNRIEAGGPAVAAGGGDWAEMDRIAAAAACHGIRASSDRGLHTFLGQYAGIAPQHGGEVIG